MINKLLFILIVSLCLAACSTSTPKDTNLTAPKDCATVWIYAPDSLILELSSGNQVLIDPAVHDFPIFCSKEEAKNALDKLIQDKKYPAKGWAYYKLAGQWTNLAKVQGEQILLKDVTSLVDWER